MECVRSVHFKVFFSEELLGPIIPKRGLKQGDPLLPYLFILYAEALSALLKKSEEEGRLHGCKIVRHAPIVSHLFFIDDSFLFCRATMEECRQPKHLLAIHEHASGKSVNFTKLTLYFRRNTDETVKEAICNELQVQREEGEFVYLKVPVCIGQKKKQVFAYIKDKIWKRIQTWKTRKLSKAGKELMIKTVAQAIPNYVMGLCLLPMDLCDNIEKMLKAY